MSSFLQQVKNVYFFHSFSTIISTIWLFNSFSWQLVLFFFFWHSCTVSIYNTIYRNTLQHKWTTVSMVRRFSSTSNWLESLPLSPPPPVCLFGSKNPQQLKWPLARWSYRDIAMNLAQQRPTAGCQTAQRGRGSPGKSLRWIISCSKPIISPLTHSKQQRHCDATDK